MRVGKRRQQSMSDWSQHCLHVADPAKKKCRIWTCPVFSSVSPFPPPRVEAKGIKKLSLQEGLPLDHFWITLTIFSSRIFFLVTLRRSRYNRANSGVWNG